MVELIRKNLLIIAGLFLFIGVFILLSLLFSDPVARLALNQPNNFFSRLFLGMSGSLIGALFIFLAVDLTLKRRKSEEIEPKKRTGYRRISKFFSNLNSLIVTMAQESKEDWEPPASCQNLYTEEVAEQITNLDLTQSAPTPDLALTLGEYFIMELNRLINRIDKIELKYGDCLPEEISAALDYEIGDQSLNYLKDFAILTIHANKEGKSPPNLQSPFVQRAFKRINKVSSKIEDKMEEENSINRMNDCLPRGGDLRPWAQDKFSITY